VTAVEADGEPTLDGWPVAGRPVSPADPAGADRFPDLAGGADGIGGPDAPDEGTGDGLASLREQIAALESRVDDLVAAAARDQERAAFRESVIDRLHAENQTLRRGELDAMFQPVRDGVVALHDLARRAAGQYRRTDQPTADRGAALLDAVAEEAADVLSRLGVSRIDPVAGEVFDPVRHRGVGTAAAEHPWQDSTVADVSATGFALAEKVIRRAEVVVARYDLARGPEEGQW
jgi:molecular chaperone GrpE (heat shock protein)